MPPAESRADRAERILDAAADLLLRVGYRRTTVEDVADHADVGKGTLYLHWKTREALFLAVLQREGARTMEDLVRALEADPRVALLPRLTEVQFTNVVNRPLLYAGYAADAGTLGKLLPKLHGELDPRHDELFEDYLRLLAAHRLLRTDRPVEEIAVAYRALLHGFLLTPQAGDPAAAAALLADTVAHAFTPSGSPSMTKVHAIAPRAVAIFTEAAELDRARLRRAYS
ncbi:TetR/AcrR family transcriptional regulator [Amycolatopsis sp. NPDC059021]|uniref:TetR/AcrR family transcriptional regulator n=1 Tax=Amycolatopsis sp. NPDC059021 TaxID=3346704 RepID=UPI00367174E4